MRLTWSALAKAELADIRRRSIERWGAEIAARYLGGLRNALRECAAEPERLRPLRGPYYIRRIRSHYLILHLDARARRLTVTRILHVRMDIERHLPRRPDTDP